MKRTALLSAVFLAGCNTVATPVTSPLKPVCLPLGNITPAQQKAAGDVLAALPAAQQAALAPIIGDWLAIRDADRACLKGAP